MNNGMFSGKGFKEWIICSIREYLGWNILLTHWFLQVLDAAPGDGFWQDPLDDEAVADPEIDNLSSKSLQSICV